MLPMRGLFERKLRELGLVGDLSRQAMHDLGDRFTLTELEQGLKRAGQQFKARRPQGKRGHHGA